MNESTLGDAMRPMAVSGAQIVTLTDQVDGAAREAERGSAGLPIAVQVIARLPPDYPARPPL